MVLQEKLEKSCSISSIEVAPLPREDVSRTNHDSGKAEHVVPREHVSVFKEPKKWWRTNFLSWRFYVTIYAGLALLCLSINLVALIAAATVHGVNSNGHILLFNGSCSHARMSSLFGHWFISGISTYLLAASAYVMVRRDIYENSVLALS